MSGSAASVVVSPTKPVGSRVAALLRMVGPGDSEWQECPMARRLPKLRRTGDWRRDVQQETERANFVEVVNLTWNNSSVTTRCLGFLRKASSTTGGDSDSFESPSHLPVQGRQRAAHPVARFVQDRGPLARMVGFHGLRGQGLDLSWNTGK